VSSVLVTGGSGFIGGYMCDRLCAAGHQVSVLDLVPLRRQSGAVRFVQGDVRDALAVRAALQGCDSVIHLAAAHHDFGIAPSTYFDVNEGGSRVLLEELDRAGIRRACFYSSVAVYERTPEPRCEESDALPIGPYGRSKLAAESLFRRWVERGEGRRALIMRPSVVFGPGNYANVFALMRQIHSRMYLPIGRGTNIKSMAYVENLVDATLFLWARQDLPSFDIYNYVDTPNLTSREICEVIANAFGRSAPTLSVPLGVALALAMPFDLAIRLTGRNLPISSQRIRKLATARTSFEAGKVQRAGFAPRVTLPEGIRRMAYWFLAEGNRHGVVRHLPPERPGSALTTLPRAAGI
jgi:GlcNAc-P-P-Und epimerase